MAIATEDFIQQIDEMSVMDLNNLVKALEEHYGVSAAAAAAPAAAAGVGAADAPAEEQTEFDVVLTAIGDKKINVIKTVREVTSLGAQGRQGVGGVGARDDSRGGLQGRGGRDQGEVRRSWSTDRPQVDRDSSSSLG